MTRLKDLAMAYPRYGYLLLHGLLKREGRVVNKKRTYRLYTEQGLQVRTKQRKKTGAASPCYGQTNCRKSTVVDGFCFRSVGHRTPLSRVKCCG